MELSSVIKENKELMILNSIKFNIWENGDIRSNILKDCNDYNENCIAYGLEKDIELNEIKLFIEGYINSLKEKNNFNQFIKKIRFYNNNIKGFKKLMECEGLENFKSQKELYRFILNNVIPSVYKL